MVFLHYLYMLIKYYFLPVNFHGASSKFDIFTIILTHCACFYSSPVPHKYHTSTTWVFPLPTDTCTYRILRSTRSSVYFHWSQCKILQLTGSQWLAQEKGVSQEMRLIAEMEDPPLRPNLHTQKVKTFILRAPVKILINWPANNLDIIFQFFSINFLILLIVYS